ncbi:hypothetical protein DXG01_009007 [Tephrocybe rancida]|nr:hypothetical protein DXG01_009007 [Tephrocybe rancida]
MPAQEHGIPGLDISHARSWNKFLTEWPWRRAGTTSVKLGARTEGIRLGALETYRALNVTLATILSLRASQGYLATEEPKFGNRMTVHALARIDSDRFVLPFRPPPPLLRHASRVSNYTPTPASRSTPKDKKQLGARARRKEEGDSVFCQRRPGVRHETFEVQEPRISQRILRRTIKLAGAPAFGRRRHRMFAWRTFHHN